MILFLLFSPCSRTCSSDFDHMFVLHFSLGISLLAPASPTLYTHRGTPAHYLSFSLALGLGQGAISPTASPASAGGDVPTRCCRTPPPSSFWRCLRTTPCDDSRADAGMSIRACFGRTFPVVRLQLFTYIWVYFDGAGPRVGRGWKRAQMYLRRNIAVVLVIGALAVFLFPLSVGPFTTTNGPATAFRAAAAAFALLFSMTTIVSFSLQQRTGCVRPALTLYSSAEAPLVQLPTLRC